jgi:hypothetical protein
VDNYSLKCLPFFDYIINGFETRIKEIQKEIPEIKHNVFTTDYLLAVDLDKINPNSPKIQEVLFLNKNEIRINLSPAEFRDGRLISCATLRFYEQRLASGYKPFQFSCCDNGYDISPTYTTYQGISGYVNDNPMDNPDFLNTIDILINKVIDSASLP